METDVDCGGPACGACALGRMCMAGRDCQSGFCNVSMNMCVMSGCLDGAKSGNETDIDCGGINCPPCGNGLGCRVGTDCMSKYCYGTTCWPTSSSCVGLTANCGATNNQSCCSNALVPGATFYRSYDVAGDANSGNMNFPATVSDFVLDRYEVTVGRFRAFVNAGVGTAASPPPAGAGARILNSTAAQGGWDPTWSANLPATTAALTSSLLCDGVYQTWTGVAGANEDKPINCISWYEAFAFCVWDGGFLPTEAEWNYAASGGTDQRAFPWGTSLVNDCTYSNSEVDAGIFCVNGANNVGSESPKGDGRWTQSDLTGNVVEWVLDWDNNYPAPCSNCANLTPGTLRVLRGGSFADTGAALRTGYRFGAMPTTGAAHYGIRCARAK
jgi:formylglycine-generating enzyme required for sulfatase activity